MGRWLQLLFLLLAVTAQASLPHAVKTVGSTRSYGHDANGNMISRYGQRLDYDSENRLTRLTTLTTTNTFGYDGGSARLWKKGTNTLQVWIGSTYEEKQGRVLFHVLDEDRTVCSFDAGTNVFEYYHNDHLHSTAVLTDKGGNRIQHHEYSAFGRDRFTESTTAFPLSRRYTSKPLDEDTGLYYYGSRYYDPELARFIQPDTIIPDFGNPQSYNRYSYVLNNPLKHIDPDGHQALRPASQSGFISRPLQNQIEFHRFLRETGQEYRPQGLYSGQYPRSFERAVERSIADQNNRIAYGRVLQPGESFISAPRTGGSSSQLTPQEINQGAQGLMRAGSPTGQGFGRSKEAEMLYRGIPPGGSQKANLGRQGVASPRGTALDEGSLRKHVLGEDVSTGVTSWTPDRTAARRFSGGEGTIIQVNRNSVADRIVARPPVSKYSSEKEVLLKGTIQGTPTTP